MANYYDEQVARMQQLINYGVKNESKKSQYTSVMNQKEGADGRIYGIVAEGTKYYIKSCPKGKESLTESFDYIGGFVNRKSCMYSSYADAVKDMDMRLMSLNEDYGKRTVVNEMNRSYDFMDKSMNEMKEDIARHNQILENIDVIYQGGKGISDKNTGVPEAPKTQEYNTKVGDPFEDKADYEENRDNKENAKDHVAQGAPFEDKAEYKENTDNMQKKDSNTPGDTYTKKAEYVPDNAVAAMNPSGGETVRAKKINESIGADYPEHDWENDPNGENLFPHEPEEVGLEKEENHFPEENPDLGAEEFGEMGDPAEELTDDEFLSQFNDEPDEFDATLDAISKPTEDGELPEPEDLNPSDGVSHPEGSHLAGDGEEIAGIDDVTDVDRNNLSADVIDDVVDDIVAEHVKEKKLKMISESVAYKILNEMDEKGKKEREYYHDDDFVYGVPEKSPSADDEYEVPSNLAGYMDKGSRVSNNSKNGTLDPRKGAPSYVNPGQVEYNKDSDYYLQNKFELGLNDDPEADYTESSAWKATEEKARKYANYRVAKAQGELEAIGSDLQLDTAKIVDVFRHALYTLQVAKNNLAIMVGVHPKMIEKFLAGNGIPFRNIVSHGENGEAFGYRDAKDTYKCIITPDGELPIDSEVDDEEGNYVIGPSLKAMGFPDMSTEQLNEMIETDIWPWEDMYGKALEEEEEKMRDLIDYVQGLEYHADSAYAKGIKNVVTEWTSLLEEIAGLMSFAAIPQEVSNKRDEAANMSKRRGKNIRGGYESYDLSTLTGGRRSSLEEERTVLHSFGDHPGYRKKPMTTPANVEVAPNGARDWNDESAKGEEPFGKKIGSGDPYDKIVDMVTREVLKALDGGQN